MMSTIENIQTRVTEVENVFLPAIRHDSEIAKDNLTQILQMKDSVDDICSRIDNLKSLVDRAKVDLNQLERQMEIAEEELRIPDRTLSSSLFRSISSFLKPQTGTPASNLRNGTYVPVEIFNTGDYFEKD